MPDSIYIGNYPFGLSKSRLPFVIDNNAFPTLYNFYVWRGRAKKKRGTSFLGQLQRKLQIAAVANNWQVASFNLVAGAGNLISTYSLGSTASISPGTLSLVVGANTYTDANKDGTLQGTPAGSGTINYATGAITISGGGATAVTGVFSYFPGLPVMGLRDFVVPTFGTTPSTNPLYPLLLAFDTVYAYQIDQSVSPPVFFSVSFYKISNNPVVWSGIDFQQFWTTNYSGALWATNNKPGFHFMAINTIVVGNPTTITTSTAHNLITGDYVWFNEITGADANLLNLQTAQITKTGANSFTVPIDTTAKAINNSGIFETLTHGLTNQDGIRWYDGDPTGANYLPSTTKGWVNFAPPLTATTVAIENHTAAKYYLVGALAILPFKDRLLFFSPWIQTSSGSPIQLIDVVLWSWNGTPYYSSLTPTGQTSDPTAYYVDQTGKGGYLSAGIEQPITTVSNNEDVLLIGFGGRGRKTRFVYTGNDIQPFLFFNINSELPSDSTFSAIALDKGAIDIGTYGIAMTDQQSSQRIDLSIPDDVFTIQALNNGVQRVNAVRDFFKEWIYFAYPVNTSPWKFPTQTFLFNYRDNTWAIFYENFTAHGTYRRQTQKTWSTTGFSSWDTWTEPWNSGSTSPLFPNVVAGNPQGYVLIKAMGTGEAISGTIKAIANNGSGLTRITSIDHCVTSANQNTGTGDFLYFSGAIGSTFLNGKIGRVISTPDKDTFDVDIAFTAGTYLGLGKFTRLIQPLIQTKQFNPYWEEGRQVRLAAQKYLLDKTENSQVTVNIYLSQDPNTPWNNPSINVPPNSLIYSQIVYTCSEDATIGLTPANVNLQTPTADTQFQVWHRMNTSLIGESFQIGITLSEVQMKNLVYATADITVHAMQFIVERSSLLA